MAKTAREIVAGRADVFNADAALQQYPWLVQRDQDCVVSPDSDGLLCGLLMSSLFGWRIRGFYDGKVLVCDSAVLPRNCVFLDMEIYRKDIRSAGQHMVLFNRRTVPKKWSNFNDCFAINNFRDFDAKRDFRWKYPFGTVHFLMATLAHRVRVPAPESAVAPLLFTDGTYHNLFRYTENSLDWLRYLGAADKQSPLHRLFMVDRYTIHGLMTEMDTFWEARDALSVPGQRGDRIAITRRGGDGGVFNIEGKSPNARLVSDARKRGEAFIRLLARATGWEYMAGAWSWERWKLWQFEKRVLKNPTNAKVAAMMDKEPLSLAITGGQTIEYTVETPDTL